MSEVVPPSPDVGLAGRTGAERVLWSGHCAVAEYAFEEPGSLPRWTLPEQTEIVVTENRVAYRDPASRASSELFWLWPQHLRLQPGNRETGRAATVTQIQLVCAGPDDTFPALVFAGGDLTPVSAADRLANVFRQAIARFRVEHAAELGLTAPEARMLARLVIGPEFVNHQGGDGQTVSLLGAVTVDRPPHEAAPPADAPPPGGAAEATRRLTPPRMPGDGATVVLNPRRYVSAQPDLDTRAADLAARIAALVDGITDPDAAVSRSETRTMNLSGFLHAANRGDPDARRRR